MIPTHAGGVHSNLRQRHPTRLRSKEVQSQYPADWKQFMQLPRPRCGQNPDLQLAN